MKSFEQVFEDIKSSVNNNEEVISLKKDLKKVKKKGIIIYILVFILMNSQILGLLLLDMGTGIFYFAYRLLIIIFALVVNIVIYAMTYRMKINIKKRDYLKVIDQCIVQTIMKSFFEDVDYKRYRWMSKDIYDRAKYNEIYDKIYSNGYVEAKDLKGNEIKISELRVVDEYVYANGTRSEGVAFYGVFACVSSHKIIDADIFIKSNAIIDTNNKIDLDSSEFEKFFDVHTKNELIAMQVLTHDIMNDLVNFKKENDVEFDIKIKENNIYIRLKTEKIWEDFSQEEYFELNFEKIKRLYNIVSLINELYSKIIYAIENAGI